MSNMDARMMAAQEELLHAIDAATVHLTKPCPPDPDRATVLADLDERLADVRGRAGVYPAIGSGRGRGALVELADGSVKWDMIIGIGVHGFGHGDLDLTRVALEAALQDTVMQGNLQCNAEAIEFAEALRAAARRGGADMDHCYPACSGAMANENALKVCMQARNGAGRVLAFRDNFIGRTVTLSHIGDSEGHREGVPRSIEVDYLPYWDAADPDGSTAEAVAALEAALERAPDEHACFVMELVQGEGGFAAAPASFFQPLLERARAAGVPIWFDEIQTFGRTDRMFRFEGLGLGPMADVVTVGKMAQGCAAMWRASLNPRPGLLSGTFLGSTAAMAVGRRVIERLASGDAYGEDGRHARLFRQFSERCEAMVAAIPDCFPDVVGGRGPIPKWGGTGGMMRLTPFGGDRSRIGALVQRLFRDGVIAFLCGHGPVHLRLLPPVGVIEPADLDAVLDIIQAAIAAEGEEG
ncbi:MAG: aminotransferase class III-fold pyridoxal phosphate-dependent enzyme [Phycisphaerales bacterium]|jgi:acetylornithine aminotransferase|nr:aminotransferase class III-fold pyridoxal phosphate-dependent enzyme [Phycisphaerales bacterium]